MNLASSRLYLVLVAFAFVGINTVRAESDVMSTAEVEARLQAFKQNPVRYMNTVPVKYDSLGRALSGSSPFSLDEIRSGAYIDKKNRVRSNQWVSNGRDAPVRLGDALAGRSAIDTGNDDAESLVDHPEKMAKTLEAMQARRLKSAKLKKSPCYDEFLEIYA
jgi:hypothetical protein